MANTIYKHDKILLKCANTVTDSIYQALHKTSIEKNIPPNSNIFNFIEQLNQDTYGLGCVSIDIDNYLISTQDLILFADLLRDTIQISEEKYAWSEITKHYAQQLYDNLMQEIFNQQNK